MKGSAAITELGVIAYLGIPIGSWGQVLGSLCVIDSKPRHWTAEQIEILRSLAASVTSTIAYRAAAVTARSAEPAVSSEAAAGHSPSAEQLLENADRLADAVSQYLARLDAYDRCVRSSNGTKETLAQGDEHRLAAGAAEEQLKRVADEFGRRLTASADTVEAGQEHMKASAPGDETVSAASTLWERCTDYFRAKVRRAEVTSRFQRLEARLDEVEREAVQAAGAEQALRDAFHAYELTR